MGSVWIGGLSKLVPRFLRDGQLDLDVVTERVAEARRGHPTMRLRTTARGTAAGGDFDGQVDLLDGRTEKLEVTLADQQYRASGSNEPNVPALNRPSTGRPCAEYASPGSSTSPSKGMWGCQSQHGAALHPEHG